NKCDCRTWPHHAIRRTAGSSGTTWAAWAAWSTRAPWTARTAAWTSRTAARATRTATRKTTARRSTAFAFHKWIAAFDCSSRVGTLVTEIELFVEVNVDVEIRRTDACITGDTSWAVIRIGVAVEI